MGHNKKQTSKCPTELDSRNAIMGQHMTTDEVYPHRSKEVYRYFGAEKKNELVLPYDNWSLWEVTWGKQRHRQALCLKKDDKKCFAMGHNNMQFE